MAYARYFKREKKRYGPFYYKSVRMPDGRIKSVYLGKTLPKGEAIETERRFPSRNVIIIALIVFLVIGATSFTGYIIFRPTLVYHTETLNMTVNTSQGYEWEPQNLGELNSIKLSGSMIGNGSVKVYIESQGKRYLILDRFLLEEKNSTLFGFVPFVRAEDKLNTTQDIELNFVDICVDTCFLTGLNESSYKLVFEVENGTILEIMEINYTIVEIEAMEEKTEKPKEFREKVIKLLPEKDNFKMNEKPRFRFTTNESVEPEGLGMFVYGPDKKLSDMKANVVKVGEGEFEIEVSKERAFRPGLYRLIIRNETYEEQTEFLWGVLAINTHKSIYLENEEAFIGIAVLDNQGHMVCDADVTLSVINPRGEVKKLRTSDGTIEVSPECRVYGVTNLPDYYTYYSVSLAGTYTMNLTAITRNGVRTITDTFEVKKQVDFDVERNGPTRIYPPAKYKMIFTIKPKRDYEGPVIEYVPSSFDITPQNGLTITAAEDIKILTWNMKLTEGYTHEMGYEFDAPDVSPYLFVLGALEIGDWKEARQWMIASDAPVEVGYCRNLDSADTIYELNQSINSNSSICLNITANNVTIDGKGYTLTYAITDTGMGVNSNGYSQITIKNLIVTQTNTTRTSSPAIRIYGGQDNQIINNTIDVYGEDIPDAYNYGILFRNVDNTTIANNTIITRTTCDYCHGIYLHSGSRNNTIEHNSITTIGDYSYGIYSTDSNQQTIYNNTIDMQDYYSRGISLYNSSYNTINQTTITADQSANVMWIEQYSSHNIITNSNMTNKYSGGWGIRIFAYSDDNNITNVNITAKYYAIALDSCQRTYIDNVYANGGGLSGIYVTSSDANDTIVNNSVIEMDRSTASSLGAIQVRGDGWIVTNTNISTTGIYAAGIYLDNSNDFNGTNLTIKTTGSGDSEAIRLWGSSTNNYFYDSTVSATNDDDVFFYSSGSGTLNLINTSIVDRSWSGLAAHTLNVYWYMDAYTNYTNGSSMSGATVTAWDKDSNQAFSESTGSSGKIPRQTVQEYWQDDSSSYYYSNYTVNASKTAYYTNTTSVNITTNKLLYLTLTETPPINITLNLDPNPALTARNVTIYGHVNHTDGVNVTNNIVNMYINDSLYYHNNNTGLLENTTTWWNTNWEYRTKVKVESNVSSDLNNTIALVKFSTTSFISEGKMKSDCGDVRFANPDSNELEYTLATNTCNSPNTIFWIWINLTGNANTTIHTYYGNSNAILKTDYTNPDEDLKLYMHFDNSSEYGENDTLVYDFSKTGNNGTMGNGNEFINTTGGKFGGAVQLDGSGDYVLVSSPTGLPSGDIAKSICTWFKTGDLTAGFHNIGGFGNNAVGNNFQVGSAGATSTFKVWGWGAVYDWDTGVSVSSYEDNQWHFVTVTYDGSKTKIYFDGVNKSETTSHSWDTNPVRIVIGEEIDQAGHPFNGLIDEFRIYNHSLSADEILAIYNSTKDYYVSNHSLLRTDGYGNYNYTFNTDTAGNYTVKVNTTYYERYAEDNDTLVVEQNYINITLNLDPNPVQPSNNASIYGHVNESDGINVTNNIVNIYINDSLYYHNNNTGLLEKTTTWWNTTQGYRKQINVESQVSATLNNTITMINFSTTDLISQGEIKSDCGDVRFADSNGDELEYTLETSTCNTSNTIFWVWANLTGNSNTTIYTYYGNSGASFKTDYTNTDQYLVLYMHFDNSSEYGENDTYVYDFSKIGNDGSCSGSTCPSWNSSGKFGGSFDFDVADDQIVVPNSVSINVTDDELTLFAWVKPNWDETVDFGRGIFDKRGGSANSNSYRFFFVAGEDDWRFRMTTSASTTNCDTVGETVTPGVWYHLVARYNGTDMSIWVNGVNKIDCPTTGNIVGNTYDLAIGRLLNFADYGFNGSIDEVRIYNRSLSQDEILAIYNSTKDYYISNHSLPRTDSYGNYNYTFNPATGGNYIVKVNTTYNGMYAEANDTLVVQQPGPPTYSQNSTNSTTVGEAVEHRLKWNDDGGLSGFIFSFDNCTGGFQNDTWVSFPVGGQEDWSNVTKVINSTIGCTIRWKVYANDTGDNWNQSINFSYATEDTIPPYFSNPARNDSLVGLNEFVRFSIDVYDDLSDVSYANGTIEGSTYDFTDSGGDQWYYDWQCTSSNPSVDFTWAGAYDTYSNYNYTTVSGISTECDAQAPGISGESREPDPTYHSDDVFLNATISDSEGNLESVRVSGNWSGSWVNYTGVMNVGSAYSYKLLSGNLSCYEVVGWRYYANDTTGNEQQGSLQVFTVQNHVPTNVSLEEPPNGTVTADNTTSFDWSNATDDDNDAITYTLQVDNDTDFLSLEIEKTGLTNSDYTLTDPEALAEDVYYWRVYSNDTCDTNLSDTWQFEINPTQSVAVSLSERLSQGINWTISAVPVDNESADGNNGSGITEYDVEVSVTGTTVDLYIKADDDLKTAGGDLLGLGNETFGYNQSNNTVPDELKFQLTLQYSDNKIGENLPNGTKIYLKFFLSAPAGQPAGTYNNTVLVKGVPYGYSP